MKIKSSTLLFWALILSLAVAMIAAACQYIAFFTEFDYSLVVFENDTFYEHFCNMLMILGVILALAVTLVMRFPHRTEIPAQTKSGIALTIISIVVAAAMIYTFIADIPEILAIRFPLAQNPGKITVFSYAIRLLRVLFAALAAAYFFTLPSDPSRSKAGAKYLSLAPTAWCLFAVLSVYFDRSTPLADPHKTYYTVLVVLIMLFFSSDSGLLAKRASYSSRFVFSGLASASTGGTVVLAFLIMLIRNPDDSGNSFSMQLVIAAAALWIFMLTRMIVTVSLFAKSDASDTAEIGDTAETYDTAEVDDTTEAHDTAEADNTVKTDAADDAGSAANDGDGN